MHPWRIPPPRRFPVRLLPVRIVPVLLALALLALLSDAPRQACADTKPVDDATAIRTVIESQLAAFLQDDGPAAFQYAAPSIQAQFETPENFLRMVKQGYYPVYRPRQVTFEDLLMHDGRWVQPLLVTASDGHVFVALYTMERQPDQSWRIGGVVLLPAQAQGV